MIQRILLTCRQYSSVVIPWGRESAQSFWYLRESLGLRDASESARYVECLGRATNLPDYPMDYTAKCAFTVRAEDGLIALPYGQPIGVQFNPEAACLELLGRWRIALDDGSTGCFAHFMAGVAALVARVDETGNLAYRFHWGTNLPPWYSSLAQARAASVFLRADRCCPGNGYADLAVASFNCFALPVEHGGVIALDPIGAVRYATEYAGSPIGVLNGLMAATIGLAECNRAWPQRGLDAPLHDAIAALRVFIPRCERRGWTLYQFCGPDWTWNVHSPRYHRMCVAYLRILGVLTEDVWFAECADRWRRMYTTQAVCVNTAKKVMFKFLRR